MSEQKEFDDEFWKIVDRDSRWGKTVARKLTRFYITPQPQQPEVLQPKKVGWKGGAVAVAIAVMLVGGIDLVLRDDQTMTSSTKETITMPGTGAQVTCATVELLADHSNLDPTDGDDCTEVGQKIDRELAPEGTGTVTVTLRWQKNSDGHFSIIADPSNNNFDYGIGER